MPLSAVVPSIASRGALPSAGEVAMRSPEALSFGRPSAIVANHAHARELRLTKPYAVSSSAMPFSQELRSPASSCQCEYIFSVEALEANGLSSPL